MGKKRKIRIFILYGSYLQSSGAINKIVDMLYDGIQESKEFLPFIMAEKCNKKNTLFKNRNVITFQTRPGRLRSISIYFSLFVKLLLIKKKPHLIHLHQIGKTFIPLYFFSRIFLVPVVITNHYFSDGIDPEMDYYFSPRSYMNVKNFFLFQKKSLNKIYAKTYFIGLSKDIVHEITNLGIDRNKVFHIQNGIEIKNNNHIKNNDKFNLTWIGRYGISKNFSLLLDVLNELVRLELNFCTYVCGISEDELDESDYEKYKNVKESIKLLGQVPDVYVYLKLCSCSIITSRSEGMSLAMLESLSKGVPVISTPVSGAKEVLEQNNCGIVVKNFDAISIAKAIEELFYNPSLRDEFSKNAKKAIKNYYTKDKMVNDHIRVYKQILNCRV